MSHIYHIVVLLLCIFNISLTFNCEQKNSPYKPLPYEPTPLIMLCTLKEHEDSSESTKSSEETPAFSEDEIREIMLVFKYSPKSAQCIIRHLQDPTYYPNNESYRGALFLGKSGTGKTTMAKAIAYTMTQQNWQYKFLSNKHFQGKYRNQNAIQLRKELESITASNKPTILIVDNLDQLLKNHNSKHHDSDMTGAVLLAFLDSQEYNEQFFFIGTINRADQLPKAYKDRFLSDIIKFPLITNTQTKTDIVLNRLMAQNTFLDDETKTFLNEELKKIGPCSGRDLKNIAQAMYNLNKTQKTK